MGIVQLHKWPLKKQKQKNKKIQNYARSYDITAF